MPNLHVKPTVDELEAGAQKALEEAEALKAKETPEVEPEPSTPEPEPSTPEPSTPEPSIPEPSKEIIKDVLKREKERNIASAQEAQILSAKNKKMTEAMEKAITVAEPTEVELTEKYSDWEIMSDFEKKMAKATLKSEKQMAALEEVVKENKGLSDWGDKVTAFIDDPATVTKYSELEGKEDEFKLFATKPTRRGMDFEDIIPAFLYGIKPEPPKKGKMFEVGSGGLNDNKPKGDKITIEEARTLRETNYEKYKALLRSGKIDVNL